MTYATFEQLESQVFKKAKKRRVAVVEAADTHVLEAVRHAVEVGLVEPLLFGKRAEVEAKLAAMDLDITAWEIVDSPEPGISALQAGIAVKEGRADFILKGLIATGQLLKGLFKEETGFRTGRLISHMNIVQLRTYPKLLALCDAAINIAPTLEQKKDILQNAVDALTRMGITQPKVAVLASAETVNEKMPESVDADALKRMNEQGEIIGCVVEGPISYDLAVCKESAETKGYESPVAGDADLLVCPNIVTANVLIKCLRHSAEALTAGIVIGGRVPVVLNSRAASAEDKYRTMILAASATE
ncbi:MAG: phosphate butyryltransferase [Deltaproteobacteria bacterium]|jgi:phosphate butyryltransferase|nr:phosphate butyryltransferase [Deltaproteobacteria bacterium]